MNNRQKLNKLCDVVTEFITATTEHLFKKKIPLESKQTSLKVFFTAVPWTAISTVIAPLLLALLTWRGMSKYEQAQIKNKKVEILKSFLPDISPDTATPTGDGKGGDGSDDRFRLHSYRRYVQGSERRYAALVALSQFDDNRDLLYQLAIQYPKEGLAVVGNMADSGTGKLHVNEVIKQIIDEQETAMNVLASQVGNLNELLDWGQKVEALLTQFAKGRTSPELDIIAIEKKHKRIRTPLLQLTVALTVDKLLEFAIAENKNHDLVIRKRRLTAFLTAAPFIVAVVAEPDSHVKLLAPLKGIDALEKIKHAEQAINDFKKELVIAAAKQLSIEFDTYKEENSEFDGPVVNLITAILTATDVEHNCKDKEDSLQIVGRLSLFAHLVLQNEHAGLLFKAAMRLATDELRLVHERTKRHSGWTSGEVSLLHGLGKIRLDEVDFLINQLNDKQVDEEAMANIALKVAALYAQMIRFGTEFSNKWDRLNKEFVPFINIAREKLNRSDEARRKCSEDKTKCLEDMKEQLQRLVKAADNLRGDESQKHVDVCIALYQTMRAMYPSETPPSKPFCLICFLSGIGLIAFGAVLCAVVGEVCKYLNATRDRIAPPTSG